MPPKKRTKSAQMNKLPWSAGAGLPNCQTHPMEWIRATDIVAKRRFDPNLPLDPDFYRGAPESFFQSLMNPDVLQEIVSARRLACVTHLSLSRRIVDMLTELDFEKRWLALGADGQRKHFIVAFQKLEEHSDGIPGMGTFDNNKVDSPELCYDEISRDGGRGFLDLLNVFLLPDNEEPPKQPFVLPNERYDALIGWIPNDTAPNRKAWLGLRRITRTRYISGFLGIVLHSAEGHNVTLVSYTHEHHKTKDTLLGVKPVMETVLGESDASKWSREQAERRKEMKLFCDSCLKPEEKAENGKMSVCRPCKAVGRDVRYCDRVCQKDAWKVHKRLCGKPLELDSAFDDIPALAPRSSQGPPKSPIPPVTPGFRRSADLLRQIRLLNENPKKEYLIDEGGDDFAAISLDEPQGAATFIIMRGYAMSSAGPRAEAALLYVYRVLQKYRGDDAVLRGQLRKEYGTTFDNMAAALRRKEQPTFDEVSREEMDATLSQLLSVGRFEEELGGFVSGLGDTQKLGMQVGPQRDVTVVVNYPAQALGPVATLVPIVSTSRRSLPESSRIGPNFALPTPTTREDYKRSPAHDKQIALLQQHREADYIVWGQIDAPDTPHAVTLTGLMDTAAFLVFRHRLFEHGAYDIDALVFVMLVLEPAMRGRKVPREAVRAQLAREYGEGYVEMAAESIIKRDGKDVYRRRDGRIFERSEILMKDKNVFSQMMKELKKVGRFPEILGKLPL
ncbi:hypothetical protein FB451DRAFT_1073901 [Mycena latifolia]|nr:hypothetical protein FB451DRAFT_1073901 [Mycena latifolia]